MGFIIEPTKERREMTLQEKEIQRHKYIIGKLKKGDFLGLPKEYEGNVETALAFHEQQLNSWEKDGDESDSKQDSQNPTSMEQRN